MLNLGSVLRFCGTYQKNALLCRSEPQHEKKHLHVGRADDAVFSESVQKTEPIDAFELLLRNNVAQIVLKKQPTKKIHQN